MFWDHGLGMSWMMLDGFFWIAIVIAIVWFVTRFATTGRSDDDTPETILKRRYARGEVDRDEFDRRLGDIRK